MNKRQKIIVSITGITLVLLILVGLTYAYFLTRIQGNTNTKSISVTTADLKLVYGDGNANIITKEKIQPGEIIGEKDFTVTNEGNSESDYIVVIDDVSITNVTSSDTTTFNSNDFVYTLTCTQKNKNTNEVSGTCDGVSEETSLPLTNNGLLVANKIAENIRQEYVLTVTYKETNENQSADMNKKLEAKVDIKDIRTINPYSNNTDSLAYNIINNAMLNKNGTELRAVPLTKPAEEISLRKYNLDGTEAENTNNIIFNTTYQTYWVTYGTGYEIDETTGKFNLTGVSTCQYSDSACSTLLVGKYVGFNNQNSIANSTNVQKTTTNLANVYKIVTAPAKTTSSINIVVKRLISTSYSAEKVLSITPDDYGTSYYYRGGVTDNYVDFAGYCWRIVRIEGDGSVKLVLASKNGVCESSANLTNNSAFIGMDTYGYDANNMANYDNHIYNASGQKNDINIFLNGGSFPNHDINYNEEFIYYDAFPSNALAKLKNEQTCIGDTTKGYSSEGITMSDADKSLALENNGEIYYDAYKRIAISGMYNPNLKCTGTKTNHSKSYPLTIDEIVFAGGKSNFANNNYYLTENAADTWWSLSPSLFLGMDGTDLVFTVSDNGSVYHSYNVTGSEINIRPAVSLISGTIISGGDGTKTNPYIVN